MTELMNRGRQMQGEKLVDICWEFVKTKVELGVQIRCWRNCKKFKIRPLV